MWEFMDWKWELWLPALPLSGCVTMGTLFPLSEPPCPPLENGGNNDLFSSLMEFL